MEPLCVLFAHHRDDPVTREHLEILRRLNPFPIVPVCNGSLRRLEDARDISKLSGDFSAEDPWSGCDAFLYEWFRHARTVEAERYMYVEWDALATMPLAEYCAAVWDCDAVAARVKTLQSHPYWDWFRRELGTLPEDLRPHAAGVVPLNGLLLSRRALEAVCRSRIPQGVFCELRMGTLLRACGFTLTAMPPDLGADNEWRDNLIALSSRPGLYHPVKTPATRPGPDSPASGSMG